VGVAAFGVSMNSKSLSEPLTLWDVTAMIRSSPDRSQRMNLVDLRKGKSGERRREEGGTRRRRKKVGTFR
jgi:hypothetical protein